MKLESRTGQDSESSMVKVSLDRFEQSSRLNKCSSSISASSSSANGMSISDVPNLKS